ncbi:alkaline phosphatase family protein [Skermanella rosea]|uniref:alkaline phosphatase D family protein n=1 Tax=Skermanella rosea TaxID=1817965 RepID=UPI0019349863|nr:alkaline phosphatase D family protein [Skermanella rosea]UEM05651.1 alkaline phosphatase family protein [Skermanella rosea]
MPLPPKKKERRELIGPVLHFRGVQGERWRVSALFVLTGAAEPPDMAVDGVMLPVPPRHVASLGQRHVWRWEFAVPRAADDTRVGYGFRGGDRWYMTVPGLSGMPRIAYTACNGTEDESVFSQQDLPRNARWGHLNAQHRVRPFHLLLHGGDQLYADAVWDDCPSLRKWGSLPPREQLSAPFTSAMSEEAENFYFDLYCRQWSQAEAAALLSTVPSVMMWDDHDIFDGWGSHPDDRRTCPVFQGVYEVARRSFALFQVGCAPDDPPDCVWGGELGTFTQGFRIGDLGIFAPDLRTERTQARVMSEATWEALPGWLDRFDGCRHLLLMSSVPMVFANLHALEKLINFLPAQAAMEDDLRDQWRSYVHEEEYIRLVRLLGAVARDRDMRITVVSGEIHLGACGVIHGPGFDLWQLTSSGIVHPAPSRMYANVLERLSRGTETIADGMTLEMVPFPETGRRYIRARNWLALHFDEEGRLNAHWQVEGEREPLMRVV